MKQTVAVLGGGITGLAAANRLTELDPSLDVLLLESGSRLGGVVQSTQQDGFLMEAAAEAFLTTPSAAIDLCRRLGLDSELVDANPVCRRALVLHEQALHPVPLGFEVLAPSRLWTLMSSRILTLQGKLRAACDLILPARKDQSDESLQSFVCRRFGRELFDRLAQPLVGSVYTGDPGELSIDATFPRFRALERKHGSLIRGLLRERRPGAGTSGARYGLFKSLRSGMSVLITALASRLREHAVRLRLSSPVRQLIPLPDGQWRVVYDGSALESEIVDGAILALPAPELSRLLNPVDSVLSNEFSEVNYASCAVVDLGYSRSQIGHPLDGFGFVVPLVEHRLILSCSFSSVKYPGRAPTDHVLLRVYIGGACQSGLLMLSNEELAELAEQEVGELLHIQGKPLVQSVWRHTSAMPQYRVGHLERVARVEERLTRLDGLAVAGSSLRGVGIPRCVESGEAAAEKIMVQIRRLRERQALMGQPVL